MTQIALQLYSMREQTPEDLLGVMKKVAEVGYQGVEFAGFFDVPVKDIKAVMEDHNLKGAGAHWVVDALKADLDQIIADSHTLGLPAVSCPGFWGVDYEDEATFHHFAEFFNQVGERCKAADLRFLYHIHGHEFAQFGDKTGMDILLDETDPDHMGLQPDIFWVQNAGVAPAAFVKQHSDRIVQLHMKDARDENWHDTEVGNGIVDVRGVIEATKDLPIDWWIVEQEAFDMPAYESIAISLNNLKGLLPNG